MPASWVKQLQDHVGGSGHHVRVPSHLQEAANWSGNLSGGSGGAHGEILQAILDFLLLVFSNRILLCSAPSCQSGQPFSEGLLSSLSLPGEVTAMAFEPIMGYLAVGTSSGSVHLFGSPPVQISWNLRPAVKVKFILFKSGTPLMVVIGESTKLES